MVNLSDSMNAARRSVGRLTLRWYHQTRPTAALVVRPMTFLPVRMAVLLLPTIICAAYYFFIAADQYQSEAQFVVRSPAKPDVSGGISFLVQLGLVKSQDDSFIVQDYITSRDALKALSTEINVDKMYNREGADFLARYPSILYGPTKEQFYKYYKRMVTIVHTDKTGITTLKVDAFRPEDAHMIAETLLTLSEGLVNQINRRLQTDAIANSLAELKTAQARVIGAQAALSEFRNKEMIIDPHQSAVALAELIAHFSTELGTVQAQITELKIGSVSGPQIENLQRKAAALGQQIAEERRNIAEGKGGLAARIAKYEGLVLEREFANRMLSTVEADLVRARAEAARQLLYLERIVEPSLPDDEALPKRFRMVITILTINVLLVCLVWLVFSGVREHATDGR